MNLDDYLKPCIDDKSNDILYLFKTKEQAIQRYKEYSKKLDNDIRNNKIKYNCASFNDRALFYTFNSTTVYFKSINEYNNIIGLKFKKYYYQ